MQYSSIPSNIANISNCVYKKIHHYKLICGKNVDCQMLNIIYYVSKSCGIYYTNREMIRMMNAYNESMSPNKYKLLKNKDFSRGSKLFIRSYFMDDSKNLQYVNPTTTEQYIDKYCLQLKLSDDIMTEVKRIAKFLRVYGITNAHSSISIAISTIYYVISAELSKTEFVKRCNNISASTVTKVCKNISHYIKNDSYSLCLL